MHSKDPLRDWADIRLFLAIHKQRSLVAAAEVLGLTQPTVGRRLAAMEERFGTPLFVRSGRRMQLTDAGAGILESARRMEREMLAIERSLEVHSTELCGEVIISATEGTGTDWLAPVLFDFHQQYPEILVKVQVENRAVDLLHREADIALRMGRPSQPALIARHLTTVGFGLYASPEYLQRAGVPGSIEDLQEHNLVALDSLQGKGPFHPPEGLPAGNYVYFSNSLAALMSAIEAGFGIGGLSHRWVAMRGRLIRVLPEYIPNQMELWLVTHEELRYSARIRAVSDFIAERVLADRSLFEHGHA
ncbi:LysR family transcriptional regulator [Seongchinamella sediminis]|uniref:LysR family transcriptional regulator n=1 Tax=Seongchinamella sediminis TaxID=2283635 RepID=A0A3L7DVV8_9GAMM|nr:LysR family transcriptional regulator [Seongchinamella sediminis]RLQ20679.1 LysR family transcriptional regulator [Seongchinamella sediminis]